MVSKGSELKLPAPGREGDGWTLPDPPREARAAAAAALEDEALLPREPEATWREGGGGGEREREREREIIL